MPYEQDKAVKAMGGWDAVTRMSGARMAIYYEAQRAGVHPEQYLTDVLLGTRPPVMETFEKMRRGELSLNPLKP